jgi:glycosyltransferase involved in cell wall biosynthesis
MALYRLGFVMEQALGHVTHYRNLRHWVSADGSVNPEWMLVDYDSPDVWQAAPVVRNNWTLRASLRAKRLAAGALRKGPLDGFFYHTQVTALFAGAILRRLPSIISLDATPINMDDVGAAYDHQPSRLRLVGAAKHALSRKTFERAAHLTTWNEWAKASLVGDYGVRAEKVTVVSPGVDLGSWRFERFPKRNGSPMKLLFVGGDFKRKGGDLLLQVFKKAFQGRCELDIVTRSEVETHGLKGVRLHHGIQSNSPELMRLFEGSDAFVLPTLGECHPVAAIEALAAGMPVIITRVGSTQEIVPNGEVGFVIEPGDGSALEEAIEKLAESPSLRYDMSLRARKRAEERFDGQRNYGELVALFKRCVDGKCPN